VIVSRRTSRGLARSGDEAPPHALVAVLVKVCCRAHEVFMRRRAISTLPLIISLALCIPLATLGSGAAHADLPSPHVPAPTPQPAVKKPAEPAATKPASTAAAKGAPADPKAAAAAPDDSAAAVGETQPQLSEADMLVLAIKGQKGPMTGALGDLAEIAVPEGYIFADGEGTRKFLELNKNPPSGHELGMIASPDMAWVAMFEFSDIGYVKDDEKADLDADELLKSLREGNDDGNRVRKERGWSTVSITGWAQPPKYDERTNNLEWALKVENDTNHNVTVNHNIKYLGRGGVMEANLMASPQDYEAALPAAKKVLEAYQFKTGHKYSEWKQGERVAAIGLTGLVTGGAIAAAAKTGLLAKMGKGVVKLIAVVGAGAAAAAAKLFGKKKDQQE
jgi:uncharacterized membrane-anchored protein